MLGRDCSCDQPSIKTLSIESVVCLPNRQHFTLAVTSLALLIMPCGTPLVEDSWKLMPGLLHSAPHAPFSFAHFALKPFTVINHNHDCILSLVSSPSESLKVAVVSETWDVLVHQSCLSWFVSSYDTGIWASQHPGKNIRSRSRTSCEALLLCFLDLWFWGSQGPLLSLSFLIKQWRLS